jgi:hypothetical protein
MKIDDILYESVSFFVDSNTDDKSENYKDLLSLANFMSNQLFYNHIKPDTFFYKFLQSKKDEDGRVRWWRMEPDGDDHFEKTGTINLYLPNGFINDKWWPTFKKHLYDMIQSLDERVTVGKIKIEGHWNNRSNWSEKNSWENRKRLPYNEGEPVANIGVIRIPILKNEVTVEDKPEMTIANTNVASLLRILGLDSNTLMGTIRNKDIPKLLLRIKNISEDRLKQEQRPTTSSQEARIGDVDGRRGIIRGPMVIDMGLDVDRIRGYLNRLQEILIYAHKNGKDVSYN